MNKAAFEKWFAENFGGLAKWDHLVNFIWHYFQQEFPGATLTEQEFCDLSLKTMNKGYSPEEMRPFYKALAPYFQRDFPRERFESLLEDFKHDLLAPESKGHPSLKSCAVSYYADKAERLWNGGEIKVPNVCPTNWVTPKVLTSSGKPVCPTCGGSGEVREKHDCGDKKCSLDTVPRDCPDCKPPTQEEMSRAVDRLLAEGDELSPDCKCNHSKLLEDWEYVCPRCGLTLNRRKGQRRKGQWKGDAPIFSGDQSVDMWVEINRADTVEKLRGALYTVGCRLQDFEGRHDSRTRDRRK